MQSTRCFIAVAVGPPALGVLQKLIKKLGSRVEHVRWTRSDQLHVTVQFLGEVDNRELPIVCRKLADVCGSVQPFRMRIGQLGTFPRNKPPRVLWAGIQEGARQLGELKQSLESTFADLGFAHESRAYTPHLTLGRVGNGADPDLLSQLMDEGMLGLPTECEIDEIHLMASVRERGRIEYHPIETVEL